MKHTAVVRTCLQGEEHLKVFAANLHHHLADIAIRVGRRRCETLKDATLLHLVQTIFVADKNYVWSPIQVT
jgi:hypothetical protein